MRRNSTKHTSCTLKQLRKTSIKQTRNTCDKQVAHLMRPLLLVLLPKTKAIKPSSVRVDLARALMACVTRQGASRKSEGPRCYKRRIAVAHTPQNRSQCAVLERTATSLAFAGCREFNTQHSRETSGHPNAATNANVHPRLPQFVPENQAHQRSLRRCAVMSYGRMICITSTISETSKKKCFAVRCSTTLPTTCGM